MCVICPYLPDKLHPETKKPIALLSQGNNRHRKSFMGDKGFLVLHEVANFLRPSSGDILLPALSTLIQWDTFENDKCPISLCHPDGTFCLDDLTTAFEAPHFLTLLCRGSDHSSGSGSYTVIIQSMSYAMPHTI